MTSRTGRRRASAALVGASLIFGACGGGSNAAPPPGVSHVPARAPASFSFESFDGPPVSSVGLAGKPAVIAFVATWDLLSQAQVRFLVEMHKNDEGRVGYALVFLQERKDRELILAYSSALSIAFPTAVADRGTLDGAGSFGDVNTVPTVLVLDPDGRVRFQKVGLATSEELRAALHGL